MRQPSIPGGPSSHNLLVVPHHSIRKRCPLTTLYQKRMTETEAISWYRLQRYSGTDSYAMMVPIHRYDHVTCTSNTIHLLIFFRLNAAICPRCHNIFINVFIHFIPFSSKVYFFPTLGR